MLDIVGVNNWKIIADELSNDKIKVTSASIRVSVAKRKSEFLNCSIQFSKIIKNYEDQENVHGK